MEKRREELQNKTLKNSHSYSGGYDYSGSPNVNIDLPDDLKESFISIIHKRHLYTLITQN